jgi:CMP-N-acetylneuraminic acid synthetase
MKYFFLICARGGSKGLKNKNLRKINKVPLIGWSIKIAKKFSKIGKIVVNSDSKRILDYAKKAGANILINRPKNLAKDTSKEIDVWKHSIKKIDKIYKMRPEAIISVPPTSPCRSAIDIKRCIQKFETKKYDVVICVTPSYRNPYFNIVEIIKNDFLKICIDTKRYSNRQAAPKTYDITTVCYIADINYIKKTKNILKGKIGYIVVPQERSIDIDTITDLKVASILKRK